ncbi:hypothetical protein LCGC14_2083570 [marine sediment metagenome]|uniref:Uncharacterized protein n=1 Tax=marine sediment metagenome TaxID=412755 RepID=A0A0F9EF40_9ZZZZ
MALALSGKVGFTVQLTQTNALDLTTPADPLNVTQNRVITSGTAADQSDLLWHDQQTLTNGGTVELVLNDGTLSNAFGTVTMDKLKGICIRNHSTDCTLIIGGAAATVLGLFESTTDILTLQPGTTGKPATFLMELPGAAGIDTTSNDTLKLEHGAGSTNSVVFDIMVWGED